MHPGSLSVMLAVICTAARLLPIEPRPQFTRNPQLFLSLKRDVRRCAWKIGLQIDRRSEKHSEKEKGETLENSGHRVKTGCVPKFRCRYMLHVLRRLHFPYATYVACGEAMSEGSSILYPFNTAFITASIQYCISSGLSPGIPSG